MRIAIKFAYNGSKFNGYARQPNQKTVEGDLIKALTKKGYIKNPKESIFRSASRTDRDVSSLGSVISFNTNKSEMNILQDLSAELLDIIAYGFAKVEPDFYPRYARYRRYRYFLKNEDFNVKKIITAASCFTGKHNFSNFAKVEEFKIPIREIDNIVIELKENFLIIEFFAKTFLWNQIRRIISALEKIGNGKLSENEIIEALEHPDKKFDFGISPAKTLMLMNIVYDFDFKYDKKLMKTVKSFKRKIIDSF